VTTSGTPPGWIYRHRAQLLGNDIIVTGGKRAVEINGAEEHVDDTGRFALSLETLRWRALP
jgi:hypothetical protein